MKATFNKRAIEHMRFKMEMPVAEGVEYKIERRINGIRVWLDKRNYFYLSYDTIQRITPDFLIFDNTRKYERNIEITHECFINPNIEMFDRDRRCLFDVELEFQNKQNAKFIKSVKEAKGKVLSIPVLPEPNSHENLLGAIHYLEC